MLVPDRGADLVYVYHTPNSGDVTRLDDIELPKGSGPRHATFWRISATQSLMILIGELDNTLRVFKFNEKEGKVSISLVQTVSTLGDGLEPTLPEGHNLAAEVAISPDGRFVYASNRNTTGFDSDFLAIYSLDHDSRKPSLSWIGRNDTHGKLPRHFAIGGGKNAEYVAVLNQVTNDLQVFERDTEGGMLGERVGKLVLGETTTDTDVGPIHVMWD
jgi:6-phosphogluconolactonase (cycloisomerase 2 family)